jgi:YbbR domain-containing protein
LKGFFQRVSSPGFAPKLKLNRKLTAVFICILVAAAFWLLIALSNEYATRLVIPVTYENFPTSKVVMNRLPATLDVTVRTTGFSILSYRFNRQRQVLAVDVSSLLPDGGSGQPDGIVSVASAGLSDDLNRILGGNARLVSVLPDSIAFAFGSRTTRKVPVKTAVTLHFEKQYDSLGTYSLMPHEVEIAGPEALVRSIDALETVPVDVDHVKGDVRLRLKIRKPAHVETATDEVTYVVPVEKFTEGAFEVPVRPTNVREDYVLKTFPAKAQVRFLVPISKYAEARAEQFDVIVNADEIPVSAGGKLRLVVISQPPFARSVTVEPERAEYILRRK